MAAGTVVSRATGLIRQMLQAAALGTGLPATTYNRANAGDPDGGAAYEQRPVTLVLCVLGAGTALATWAAPAIISVYQHDTPATHDAFELTVTFARFLLPRIFFYGVFSIFGQVLNARNRFGAMMWTPVLNNSC